MPFPAGQELANMITMYLICASCCRLSMIVQISAVYFQATFMGRSLPVLTGARGVSQAASRSYVFGRDDSNSAAAPADGSSVVRS